MKHPIQTLLAVLCLPLAISLQAIPLQTLTGQRPAASAQAAVVGPLATGKQLTLAISLPWRNAPGLTNFLRQLSDPGSPNFRRYLTPAEFTAQFGPTVADYDAVIAYARSNGLAVTGTSANRALVSVRGPVSAINRALHVTMTEYQHPTEGRTFYAPDVAPSLELGTAISHIGGLDNFYLPRPLLKLHPLEARPVPAANGSAPNGLYMGADFRNAYAPGVTLDGSGQSVALIEFDGYYPGDIASYEKTAGLPAVPITNVLVSSTGAVQTQNGDAEVSLDIDMAISMATNLQRVMVYETESSAEEMVNRIAEDGIANQISCSWSFPDAGIDATLQEFAAQGQSFFAASGDGDAYPTGGFSPSDSPYATAVGGTTLTTSNAGSAYGGEVVWNAGAGEGSGGGISSTYLIPTWQTNINMATNQGSTTHRNVPDVAMNADNVFLIYENGAQIGVVGTSCAAPLWAGFNALANQLAAQNGMNPDGDINPAVYGIAQGPTYSNTFHDITVGNNESSTSPTKYVAEKGYDLCTGWGSPTGSNMLYALGLPEALRLTPLIVPPFAGPAGGPFAPSELTFELVNGGPGVLPWGVLDNSPYFEVSPSSGNIPEGGETMVTVTLNPSTTGLPVGVYATTLQFTNLSDEYVQNRTITLLVAGPPVIETEPTNVSAVGGETADFHVGMATNSQLAFQWWKNNGTTAAALTDNGRITGSQTATLAIASVTNGDAASYFVVVSNAAGMVTSSNATLTLAPSAPVVAVAPVNVTVMPGASAYFSVVADGTQPITYQWRLNGTNLFNSSLILGTTTTTLTLSNVSAASAGTYSVVLANALGTNVAAATLSVVNVTAPGAALTLLSSFAGGTAPQNPVAGLLVNSSPFAFYGTSLYGGADGYGCVYRMAATGTMSAIGSFDGTTGEYPVGGLLASGSFFYGVAAAGGNDNDGTIFRVNASGQMTVLRSFSGEDGDLPESSLFQGKDGAFYGASTSGGIYGLGNVFRITAAGVFSNLVSFDGISGSLPLGTLAQDVNSNLYGTTEEGGLEGLGNIFMITPSGQTRTLISFTGSDGAYPVAGLTLDAAGNLYGTTHDGGTYSGGEVFVLHPDGSGDILYSFGQATNDGANPYAQLALGPDGNFYGSTEAGGEFGMGTIFVISPAGNLKTLASFDGFQGNDPAGQLTPYQGNWYGVTYAGGFLDLGASFKFTVSGPLQITGQPSDDLVDEGATALFQVATYGSAALSYQWRVDGTNLTDGNGVSGSAARVLTIADATQANVGAYSVVVSNVYGAVTSAPGLLQVRFSTPEITEQPLGESVLVGQSASFAVQALGEFPLVYQWFKDGAPMTNGSRISGADGPTLMIRQTTTADSGEYAVMVSDLLYDAESSNAVLTVSPVVATGATLQSLHSFGGNDGAQPYASLMQGRDGKLYGTTVNGGRYGDGSIFDVTTNGVFALVYSFSGGDDGAGPFAGLVQGTGTDNNFYGVASSGGTNSDGTLFRMSATHTFTALHSFNGTGDGEAPEGTLTVGADGNLYGTTAVGGEFDGGTIYSATSKGAVSSLYSFTGYADGNEPLAGLALGSDGNFYGTAYLGGTNDLGSVYKTDASGDFTLLHAFAGYDGADPVAGPVQGADGKFYGTAFTGGANGWGTVYSITTNGDITTLYSFDYENSGAFPNAGLMPSGNGGFIGAVQQGGPGDAGGIYEITTNGVWAPLVWFTGANGAAPLATPVRASDGYFYGTTYYGGVSNVGSIYRFQIPEPPQITAEPVSVFAALGTPASFSVTATGATPLGYQWYFDGGAIAGATNGTYTVAAIAETNVGNYFVVVSNSGGATNSTVATLSIISPLIGNGGFETGDFTGWTLSGNSGNFSVQAGAEIAHSGSFGARLAASNSLGYLTTTVATTNGVTYRLSLWLDSADGVSPNEFIVSWNGGIIFDGTNLPALGWTNLQFTVTATNSASTVGMGARDDTSFLAVDDVSLTPVPALQTTTITQTPGQPAQVTFNWSAEAGLQYQVQYKTSLTDAGWTDLGGPVIASGGPVAISDFVTNTQRFYRVILIP